MRHNKKLFSKKIVLVAAAVVFCVTALSSLLVPSTANAAPATMLVCDITGVKMETREQSVACQEPCKKTSDFLGFPTWNRGLQCRRVQDKDDASVKTTSTVMDDVPKFVWTVALNGLDILLRIAGILAVVMLLYNGFQYITAAGSSDKISKAKTGMLQSIVGLLIAVSAAAIIGFIVGNV
jgi:hypothetical protein